MHVVVPSGRVGALDDPIWSLGLDSSDPILRKDSHNRWWGYGIVGLIMAVLIGLVVSFALGSGHPGGDPGGAIAAEVKTAASETVPPGSQIVGRQVTESQFGGCGFSNPGSGWSTITGGMTFKTSLADAQVVAADAATLRSDGWTETADTPSSASWTKTLDSGSAARLRLIKGYLITDGWTAWIDAQPQGSNCGGPSTL